MGLIHPTIAHSPNDDSHDPPAQPQGLVSREIEDRIHNLREEWKVPGLQLTIVASQAYRRPTADSLPSFLSDAGYEDGSESGDDKEIGEWRIHLISSGIRAVTGEPVTSDTLFPIASNTKAITALALFKLMKDGATLPSGELLSLNTRIKDLLPGFGSSDRDIEENVTLLQFLSMQSGIPSHDWGIVQDATPEQQLLQMKYLRASARPGETYQYTNYHYHTLPLIFPVLAGMKFESYIQQHFFEPWGMKDATFNFQDAVDSGKISESFMRMNGSLEACQTWRTMPPGAGRDAIFLQALGQNASVGPWSLGHPNTGLAGGGGILMSGNDQAKFLRKFLDPHFVSKSGLAEMRKKRILSARSDSRYPEVGTEYYGIAQEIYTYRDLDVFGHWGGLPGQSSRIMYVPERGIAIMISINDDGGGVPFCRAISQMVLDDLLGFEPTGSWIERYAPLAIDEAAKKLSHLPIPPSPRPGMKIKGEYHDDGYGSLRIQSIQYAEEKLQPVLLNAAGQGGGKNPHFTEYDRRWATHLVFTHIDGPIWQWTLVRIYPEHHRNGSVGPEQVSYRNIHGTCVFKDDGVGFFGDFWNQGPGIPIRQADEGRTEEMAEVWFRKISSDASASAE